MGVRRDLLHRRASPGWSRAAPAALALVSAIGRCHRSSGRFVTVHNASTAGAGARVSFHPNDIARRTRLSSIGLGIGFLLLLGAFFRTQVIENRKYAAQSEENRLRRSEEHTSELQSR